MMKFSMKKVATAAMATVAVLAMGAGSALAAPTFTINPNVIPGVVAPATAFQATFISGNTSELLHQTTTGNFGSGWAQFTSFANNGTAVLAKTSGLQAQYGLYLLFDLVADYTTGGSGNGSIGSNYNVKTLNFTVYADPTADNTYTNAFAPANQEAVVSGIGDDIALAVGRLSSGVAGIDALGGAFINTTELFAVCTGPGFAKQGNTTIAAPTCGVGSNIGASFFAQPIPFYDLAFDAFNNTSQGIARGIDLAGRPTISIQNAVGGVDFNKVPEPGSMALLGIALAGLGVSSRRRKAAKTAS